MKLSEVKGERVFDVMADLVRPLCNIARDGNLKSLIKQEQCPEGMEPKDFMLERVSELVPDIIKTRRDDVVDVLCAIGGMKREDYVADMTLMSLWADVMELMADEDFIDFLASANMLTGQSPSTSD